MEANFYATLALTFKLAGLTTLVLCPIGLALGAYLAFKDGLLKLVIETLTWMPLILPPTVLGFYLLVLFAPENPLGAFLQKFNIHLVFSFSGLVLASVIFSLPFMVNPIQNALKSLPQSLKEASYTLGKSKTATFFQVLLPNIKPALLMAIITTFAHTVGEFGVVMMVGGNIEGETRVASIAIYTQAEANDLALANRYALTLSILSFVLLFSMLFVQKRAQAFYKF
ncbi:molybdate ABC transporter permease subunit [Helicobacter ailurogastricus]|uniref:Molybdenum transport system permease n=1 Tax=Helicobacter ailurogastricus TaxID=1578720 RepID=A0A0K2XFI2_9HELI|nr:molybdate ABC transporter permease subunit [Helicobacter ailurogastricus]CRF40706.1 Molybdenum transport system permease protein ModB (TC 3.A.1.8.1) [Helicobacter ailurogastricus]CRF43099.1 Molybdenum transport system permease protein ModB (TC 3.A.1.8.1) [Helicobacter ailurogastricus]CRF44328.1 Molybdenum transport system permease protein ModB (TC 3.A.1.8.1) [Helicobacter ailurogastricus]CRF52202.1 Molybdenum transport system permease protein ModB (TC 3.A.1.8.1) [Helicobacter ailurogastricus